MRPLTALYIGCPRSEPSAGRRGGVGARGREGGGRTRLSPAPGAAPPRPAPVRGAGPHGRGHGTGRDGTRRGHAHTHTRRRARGCLQVYECSRQCRRRVTGRFSCRAEPSPRPRGRQIPRADPARAFAGRGAPLPASEAAAAGLRLSATRGSARCPPAFAHPPAFPSRSGGFFHRLNPLPAARCPQPSGAGGRGQAQAAGQAPARRGLPLPAACPAARGGCAAPGAPPAERAEAAGAAALGRGFAVWGEHRRKSLETRGRCFDGVGQQRRSVTCPRASPSSEQLTESQLIGLCTALCHRASK